MIVILFYFHFFILLIARAVFNSFGDGGAIDSVLFASLDDLVLIYI
jgi:hypothetical protein